MSQKRNLMTIYNMNTATINKVIEWTNYFKALFGLQTRVSKAQV